MGYSDAYLGGYGEAAAGLSVSLLLETDPDTWEDLSEDLISGNTIRGRQSALDQYQAGTCSVVLANEDRTYDPTYASSPLAGHILPMKRVKLLGVYDGVQYPLFAGYADRWTQNREGPRWGTTTLQATDGFKVLERTRLAPSGYAQEVTADGPVAWWRLDELGGTVARDSSGGADLAAVGSPLLGEETLLARDPGGAASLPTDSDGFERNGAYVLAGGPLTVEFLYRHVTGTTGNAVIQVDNFAGSGFAFDTTFSVGLQIATAPGVGANAPFTGGILTDLATHHVVAVWNDDGTLKVWIDGVDRTTGTPSHTIGDFAASQGYMGIGATSVVPGGGFGTTGTIDEVALYDHALTPARIAAHAATLNTPWDGDSTGERIERVLDAAGWPDDLRDIDTGQTTLQPAELDMSALEHAQKVEATENGNLYVQADGTIRFEDRNSDVNQDPVAAFSDDAGGDLPITFSDPEISDDQIRNDVTVSRLEGVAQNARDATSIATYQVSSYVRDGLYHDDDDHSRYLAQFILQAYKDPAERVSRMAVNPYRDPDTLFPAILALELTDRITLTETPQNVTPEVSRTVVVEGISHTFAAKSWEATFNLSENAAQTQGYWQLGIAGFSELGQTTRLYL